MRKCLIENITDRDKEIFKDSCMMCIQSYWDAKRAVWMCAAYDHEVDIYAVCGDKWSRLDAIKDNVLRW